MAVSYTHLDSLLYPEDIPTLQEYIGYCLIPSNKGQRMMVIKGSGGEGKSQIGAVLGTLFGSNMKDGSICLLYTSGQDVFLPNLRLIHRSILTEAVGEPVCCFSIQCPGQRPDIFGVVGCNAPIDCHRILQRLVCGALLLVHQGLRRDGSEQGHQFSFAHIAVDVYKRQ